MNRTLAAARELGINIIFAPSDVTSFYTNSAARKRTLSLKNATLPPTKPKFPTNNTPPFPLSSATDGGCDAHAPMGSPWKRQIESLTIDEQVDYLIAADLPGNAQAGTQELWNIIRATGIQHLIYMGVVRFGYPNGMHLPAVLTVHLLSLVLAARKYVHHGAPFRYRTGRQLGYDERQYCR
jgi:hypothetical protein|eukprot:COSAG02_NODE_17134_length_1026_cov_1.197411_2_plen_181_part_00